MKKLKLAIIGQGRSGKNIHGLYYTSDENVYYDVAYVVDADEGRRLRAEKMYPNCKVFADYKQLLDCKDIDIVVNASYSDFHFEITLDLLQHGFNVLVEKPFSRTRYECDLLMKTAQEKGVLLAVFQQTFFAPFYEDALSLLSDGRIGDIKQINIRYNGFARRWDWQTLQKRVAGSLYNTGPHPVGMALGFLGFDENAKIIYSKLDCVLTSGDSDDYVKIIMTAPNKPIVDIEISSLDAFCDYTLKVQGSKGTFKSTPAAYQYIYLVDGENPERPVQENFLADANGEPIYCSEQLIKHEEKGTYKGDAFSIGTPKFYENLYYALLGQQNLVVLPKHAAEIISVIETVHAENPLPLKY